ncbi:MAG: hypothetical protein DBP02_15895 [gamma proteobacterium symbiont of Ctena orbiculata]|nr:MAG: hypothetical protein DBP02_15895 [gamma proteobacterium symbiont of Ctena orbiculata]
MKESIRGASLVVLLIAICFGLVSMRPSFSSLVLEAALFLFSLYALVKAADVFTDASVHLGGILGLSHLGTGILIIAIGTSAPELFSSIGAAIEGEPEMVIGNVLGTVVANSLLGIGCGAMIASYALTVHKDVFGTQMSVFLTAVILVLGSLYDGVLSWYEGALMLVVLVFYLNDAVKNTKGIDEGIATEIHKDNEEPHSNKNKADIAGSFVLLVVSLAALFFSGDFVVSSLIEGGTLLDVSRAKLATTVLAIGTSIPEIATAIMLVRKKKVDALFGEIIGSNIFGLLGILGSISLFGSLAMRADMLIFLLASLFFMFIITSVIMNDRHINRIEGVSLVSLFVVFTIQLVNL